MHLLSQTVSLASGVERMTAWCPATIPPPWKMCRLWEAQGWRSPLCTLTTCYTDMYLMLLSLYISKVEILFLAPLHLLPYLGWKLQALDSPSSHFSPTLIAQALVHPQPYHPQSWLCPKKNSTLLPDWFGWPSPSQMMIPSTDNLLLSLSSTMDHVTRHTHTHTVEVVVVVVAVVAGVQKVSIRSIQDTR